MKNKQNIYNIFILLFIVLLTGCSSSIELTPLAKDDVVLAFGDSLTFGTGASPEASYPTVLANLIDRKVVNAGIPGEVTEQGLKRLPSVLDEYQPTLLILCHGGNDILRQKHKQQTIDNLKSMINIAINRNINVVLVGVPEYGLLLTTASFYGDIAKEFNIPFEEDALSDILFRSQLKSDRVHPNAEGYSLFAEAIYDLLQMHGVIE